jgi:GT2 family glycosyltransferase
MQSSTATPLVACVLVNWNNWRDTADCLASLALQDYPNLRVIVVDNGSTNDSLAQLHAAHPPNGSSLAYIANGENLGFPRACNIGARHPLAADAGFLWFLNNDTVAPPDTTCQLVATALAAPRAGIVGAALYYAHHPAKIQAWGGGRISRWSAYNRHYLAPTPFSPDSYITFASAFIRRECFDQLGGLYEGVFMYFEDADFCLRAQAAGWQLTVAPATAILHKEGGSSIGAAQGRSPRLERIVTVSGLTFLSRHAPIPFIAQTVFLFLRLAKRVVHRDWTSLRAVLEGASDWRRHRITPVPDHPQPPASVVT